jgi:hypothetical protein
MIKSSQIKRTSGERSTRDYNVMKSGKPVTSNLLPATTGAQKDSSQPHSKPGANLLDTTAHNFALMQRSFHNGAPILPASDIMLKGTGVKGSVTSSPSQKMQKKSQSITSKNSQRQANHTTGGEGGPKVVNLGILN